MNLLPRHRRSQGGGGKKPAPFQLKCHQHRNDNNKALCFFIFLEHFRVYNSIRIQQTNINIDDQMAWAPAKQIFAIQFKCITREKFRVFVLKIATFIRPSSNHFVNLMQ